MGNWNRETIYWDSAIFISWLSNEVNRPDGEFNGVVDCVDSVGRNEINVVVSKVMLDLEVLDAFLTIEGQERFKELFGRRNVIALQDHPKIQEIAKEIREYYQREKNAGRGKNVGAPDAIHLATAIHYQVDAFYTFDDGRKKKERGLLELNGNVAGYDLLICKPPFTNRRMFFV